MAGDLVAGKPWTYLPHTARLYFRKSQLPVGETFRPKTALAVAMLRQIARALEAPVLGVSDGAYAADTVVPPCLNPPPGQRRIDVVSRPRTDARLYHPPVANRVRADGKKRSGPDRRWGRRMPSPKGHAEWGTPWKKGKAHIYRRTRTTRYWVAGTILADRPGPSGASVVLAVNRQYRVKPGQKGSFLDKTYVTSNRRKPLSCNELGKTHFTGPLSYRCDCGLRGSVGFLWYRGDARRD